jgi:hypothetical protein
VRFPERLLIGQPHWPRPWCSDSIRPMTPRLILAFALASLLALLAAVPAGAASVAYIDDHNLWLSSPDGSQKFQMTQGGTEDASWNFPSQGPDGTTVVSHRDTFEGGSKRPVLYRYGADGTLDAANVMPVYSGATAPVYPITLDMDWQSNAVAYGYSYCGFACQSVYRGYWLTFSDQQGAHPTNPQGQSDAYNPTFYGTRVVSSDSGGNIFVQPDVAEAPFTNSYQGWIGHADGYYLSRAEVSPAQNMVAIEWSRSADNAEGIIIARHQGTVPSDIADACDVPTVGASSNLTFSPDGTQMAWEDGEGVKAAQLQVRFPLKATRAAFVKGLTVKVVAARAGRIDAAAGMPKKVARRLRLKAGASAARVASRGVAAAATVVVARGHTTAKRAGQTVKLRLRPTKAAKRAAKRLRKVTLTIKVSQAGATGRAKVKLR